MVSSTQDFSLIKNVLDKYFSFEEERGGNSFVTDLIPVSMLAPGEGSEDVSKWIAIQSTVDETAISQLENFFTHKLPASYKFFLQQRHFVDLWLGGYGINFFKNYPGSLVDDFNQIIEDDFSDLLQRNYIPFANHGDNGVVCFDATKIIDANDYPVVWFDHEDGYSEPELYAKNFLNMFSEFDEHLNNWIKNYREEKKGK